MRPFRGILPGIPKQSVALTKVEGLVKNAPQESQKRNKSMIASPAEQMEAGRKSINLRAVRMSRVIYF